VVQEEEYSESVVVEEAPEEVAEAIEPEKINEAPQIKYFHFTEKEYYTGDLIAVSFKGQDPENRPLRSTLSWTVNGEKIFGEKSVQLQSIKAKKDDVIECHLLLSDGEKEQEKVIRTKVKNSHPTWKEDPRAFTDLNGHIVQAEDLDGDVLKYTLQGGPKGMTISQTGRIEYRPSIYEPGGEYQIAVMAEDPDGALVRWDFSISLDAGK